MAFLGLFTGKDKGAEKSFETQHKEEITILDSGKFTNITDDNSRIQFAEDMINEPTWMKSHVDLVDKVITEIKSIDDGSDNAKAKIKEILSAVNKAGVFSEKEAYSPAKHAWTLQYFSYFRQTEGEKILLELSRDSDNLDIVKELMENGVKIESKDGGELFLKRINNYKRLDVLLTCYENNATSGIKEYVHSGMAFKDEMGKSILHHAVMEGKKETVRELASILVQAKDLQSVTPLMLAARRGDMEIVKILFDKSGRDILIKDREGKSAVDYAEDAGCIIFLGTHCLLRLKPSDPQAEAIQTKIQNAGNLPPSKDVRFSPEPKEKEQKISRTGSPNLNFFSEQAADEAISPSPEVKSVDIPSPSPEVKSVDIPSPLMEAAKEGNLVEVKRLIASGADINFKNEMGLTPLHQAIINGHDKIAWYLILQDSDLTLQDKRGMTPLHHAASKGNSFLIEQMHNQNPFLQEIKDGNGKIPLHHAAASGDKDSIELLVDQDNINAQDNKKKTALMDAAVPGHLKAVDYLLSKGADKTLKDENNMTAFDLALYRNIKNRLSESS